jgi:inhibitor of cysteine peptidase
MPRISAITLATTLILSSVSLSAFADQTVRIPDSQSVFTLQLKANATTGYQWFLEDYNPTYFTFLGYQYIAPNHTSTDPNAPKLVGAPGLAQFKFQVNPSFHQGPLTSTIHLVYGQPWNMTATTGTTITLISEPPTLSPTGNSVAAASPHNESNNMAAPAPTETLSPANTEEPTMATVAEPSLQQNATMPPTTDSPNQMTSKPSNPPPATPNWLSLPGHHSNNSTNSNNSDNSDASDGSDNSTDESGM